MRQFHALALLIICSATFGLSSKTYACELKRPIMFAGLDWDSSRFHNAVARFILEKGYGCKTDELPGSTMPLLAGLAKGDIDVMMEIWKLNLGDAWTKQVNRKKVIEVGVNFPDAEQGWYIPRYLVEGDAKRGIKAKAPDLKKVSQLPKYKKLFTDPEEPSKGRFINCILGWSCEINNTKKLDAYKLTKDYVNFRPGTSAALDAVIASSYKRGKPFVTYYWGPSWILGKYDLVMLEEPAYTKESWEAFNDKNDLSKVTAFPLTKVLIGSTPQFAKTAPQVVQFLKNYRTKSKDINGALAKLKDVKGATYDTVAREYLLAHRQDWQSWLPAPVAQKVLSALGDKS